MRAWQGRDKDDGSIHSMGNGKLCAYGQGPDLIQIFGPPYSSPSLMSMLFMTESIDAHSTRLVGTAIWHHELSDGSKITDFIDKDIPCLARKVSATSELRFNLSKAKDVYIFDNTSLFRDYGFSAGYVFYSRAGRAYYNDYPLAKKIYFQILIKGANSTANEEGIEIRASGQTEIFIVGGIDYPEVCLNAEAVIKTGFDKMHENTGAYWKAFSKRRIQTNELMNTEIPWAEKFREILDAVVICIKTQQDKGGGVIAGHNFHLPYIRDQYGVFRCMLKTKLYEEAKAMLLFYWNVWKKKGILYTAQPAGEPNTFHRHENDDVEVTGYLILQSFDYVAATNDEDILIEIYPMLKWAFERQKIHLVNGMLPFNGDETYIAGGVLPRTCLDDGSAETTMLFITGGEKLIEWLTKNNLASKDELQLNKEILTKTRSQYRENFLKDGGLITNNPERKKYVELPRFRHGVCEKCLERREHSPLFFGWTQRSENDRYLCVNCLANHGMGRAEDVEYNLQSVSLIPVYIGSDLFTNDELLSFVDAIAKQYEKTGNLPSRPDGNLTVGYDYGLLLYALTKLKHPLADEIYRKTLAAADQTDVYVEYYIDGIPEATRCRPWESGINLEALICYVNHQNKSPASKR